MHRCMRHLILLGLALTAACASDSEAPPAAPQAPQSIEEAATLSASRAAETTTLVADIDQLVANGFASWIPGLGVAGGVPAFALPADCSANISLDRTRIELASECTLPSGRHVKGTLVIALGGDCGLAGLTVEFDLLVESAPGANDELATKGKIALKHGGGELWLSTILEHSSHIAHDVEGRAAGCFNLDLPERRAAFDGVVSLDVDSKRVALFRASDLQHMLCEWLPYTGTVHLEHDGSSIDVTFDRDTPTTGVVTVTTAAGTSRVTLPVPTGGWCTAGVIPPTAAIDYQTCGGCGNPVPPTPPGDPVPEPPPLL
jgi:hypothetical protein